MASICNPNEEMSWQAVKKIVDGIDSLAAHLSTPDYVKLRSDERRPFKFDDVQRSITLYQAFDLAANGSGSITARYLSKDAYGDNDWEPSDVVLKNMAEDEDLFFVAEPDGCICKTIFQVLKEGGRYTLNEIDEMGCCQSLFVPAVGDTVPLGQNILPTKPLATYIRRGNPTEGRRKYEGGICRANSSGVGYKFTTSEKNSPLETAARKFKGYLTWMARADYMATIWDKLDFILHCCRNGGSSSGVWWSPGASPPGRRDTECSPFLCEVIRTLSHDGIISSNPGCLIEADTCVEPWEQTTCGGVDCGSEGPKFYCETLNQMDEVIKKIKSGVRKYSASGTVGCCCSPDYTLEGASGESFHCAVWLSDGLKDPPNPTCGVVRREIVTVCNWKEREDPEDPDSEFNVSKSATGTETATWSGEILPGEAGLECLYGSYSSSTSGDLLPDNESDYEDYSCSSSSSRSSTASISAEDMIEVAIEDAIANGGTASSVMSAIVGNQRDVLGGSTPCYPGRGYVGCYTYRITLTPPVCSNHCFGGGYASQSVSYDVVCYVEGVEKSRTARSTRCAWKSSKGMFVSAPQNFPASSDVNFYYAIEFDEDDELQLCLSCQ